MYCKSCGAQLAEDTIVCPVCNAVLEEENTYVMGAEAPLYNSETIRDYGFYQNGATSVMTLEEPKTVRKKFITAGTVISIIAAALMLAGILLPAIDFRAFHEDVDLQYNILKICKNVALISSMWRAIPVGFYIAIALMFILAFVRVPIFRILPCLLAIAMLVLMLADMGNIIEWSNNVISDLMKSDAIVVNFETIVKGFMYGIYTLTVGVIVGIVSCFIK